MARKKKEIFAGSKWWILLAFVGFLMAILPIPYFDYIGWSFFGVGLLAMLLPATMKIIDRKRGFE